MLKSLKTVVDRRPFEAVKQGTGFGLLAITILILELFQASFLGTSDTVYAWKTAFFSITLAFGIKYPTASEVLYILLFVIFSLSNLGAELVFPIFGIYFITILLFIKGNTLYSLLLLFCIESLEVVHSTSPALRALSALISFTIVVSIAMVLKIFRSRMINSEDRLKRTRKEAEEASKQIRETLALELHDHLARDLARLAITTDALRLKYPDLAPELTPLSTTARTASQYINPIIRELTKKKQNDSLKQVIRDCQIMLKPRMLKLLVESENHIELRLNNETTYLATLFIRESSTNALKYAKPGSTVTLFITVESDALSLSMQNIVNPVNISTELSGGFGLQHLQQRFKDAGGSISFRKQDDTWTIIGFISSKIGAMNE